MRKIFLVLIIGLVGFWSCEKKPSQAEIDYRENVEYVLNGHDELMKDMTRVSQLIQETESKIDTTEQGQVFNEVNEKLKSANDQMFAWMRDFSKSFPDINKKDQVFTEEEYEERTEDLEKFKVSLNEMEAAFEESIREAEQKLNP